jgi:hypothetical protein
MWKIHFSPIERRLSICLMAEVTREQAYELAAANARALEATAGQPFKAFIDMRRLFPMEPDAVSVLADLKRVMAMSSGFSGMAILADSPTVAMQQHRTRVSGGRPSESELITLDEGEAKRFLGESP